MRGTRPATIASAVVLLVTGGAVAAAPAGEAAKVSKMFSDYGAALLARDFEKACKLTAPETDRAMITNLRSVGVAVRSCAEGFRWVYSSRRAKGQTARIADQITRSTKVAKITVVGSQATIVWSASLQGRRVTVSNSARRVGGSWQLVDTD